MTERINHAAEAIKMLEATHVSLSGEAQVHATLALVEQQRIANLIALGDKFEQPQVLDALLDREPPNDGKGWVHHGLQPVIAEVLGL